MRTSASTSIAASIPLALLRAAFQWARRRPHRLRRLDPDHAGGAPAGAAAAARHRHQALPDRARGAARGALFQGRYPLDVSDAGAVRRQSRRRARRLARLFRQGAGAADSGGSGAAGGAAAIAGTQRPDRHPAAARAGRDKVLARMVGPTASSPRSKRPKRAPSRARSPRRRCRSRRRIWRSIWCAMAPGGEIVTTIDAGLQGAAERLARRRRAISATAPAWPRSWSRTDAQRARLSRRHGLLGPPRGPDRSGAPRRARRARRSSPSSTAWRSTSRSHPATLMDDAPTASAITRPRISTATSRAR